MKAPEEETDAAKAAWEAYYGNHNKNESFRNLRVADIFMGGGTTIVEGSRLGMEMYGNDLNPVAWLVVKNSLAQVEPDDVQALLATVEADVKPQIMPFCSCDCPRGHKGKWTHKPTGKVMGEDFDPLALTPEQRPNYEYEGPEVIYTFWAKHGRCQATECSHRTPIMTSPVIATKSVTVKAWKANKCKSCKQTFDIEQNVTRMAPNAEFVISPSEPLFSMMSEKGNYACPHCGEDYSDPKAANDGVSASLGKAGKKKVTMTLLVHPKWLSGTSTPVSDSSVPSQMAWNVNRHKTLALVEVRGTLPPEVSLNDWKTPLLTGGNGGSVPKRSHFTCKEPTCGLIQDVLDSVKKSGEPAPYAAYAVQAYCPTCDSDSVPMSGRFFDIPNVKAINASLQEWDKRKDTDLDGFWPRSEIKVGAEIGDHDVNGHFFTHWWRMFNSRQLFIHSLLLRSITTAGDSEWQSREVVLGVFQQYLRNQNMFCFWNTQRALEPLFSDNHFHPKLTAIENSVFSGNGRGDFASSSKKLLEAIEWASSPWEIATSDGEHSTKLSTGDSVCSRSVITCLSATSISTDDKFDLIVTDPPFGDLVQYSELSDFFYVWLRLGLCDRYPEVFQAEYTPKALEAVSNRVRHSDNPDAFYQKVLTEAWSKTHGLLNDGGILAFTFHHSEDEPWVAVLESLFDAGFILEATYPIRSDYSKGDGQFGSQKIEFDIIHVCRKRIKEPETISWARLRRQIMKDVRQLQEIIEQHQEDGLGEADLQVIRRGKALEYFSRHYGKVYIEKGREDEFTVKDALVGINQLLDDESDTTSEAPPVLAEPYTRQFLRLFADKSTIDRDQMQKYLRGTGVSPSEFLERGWCSETKKIFTIADPLEWARQWKGKPRKGMSRDFDQTYFLIGACYDESGIKASDTLNSGSFVAHPAISDLLTWFGKHGSDSEMRSAAKRAKQIYSTWLSKNTKQETTQRTLFDLEDDE